jgi:cell division control protein 24
VALKQRLALVPGFDEHLQRLEEFEMDDSEEGGPFQALWKLFRIGYPLLTIYNTLGQEPLVVDNENANEAKKSKIAIFLFIKACLEKLNIPPAECFVIGDLTGNDTTGFVKV